MIVRSALQQLTGLGLTEEHIRRFAVRVTEDTGKTFIEGGICLHSKPTKEVVR
jgi:hypothetical protein